MISAIWNRQVNMLLGMLSAPCTNAISTPAAYRRVRYRLRSCVNSQLHPIRKMNRGLDSRPIQCIHSGMPGMNVAMWSTTMQQHATTFKVNEVMCLSA